MKKIVSAVALLVVAGMCAISSRASEPTANQVSLLSRLAVGQQVRILNDNNIGFNIEVANDAYIKNYQRQHPNARYVAAKITEIGSDYLVVVSSGGTERAIAARAIVEITKLPEPKAEAEEPKK